jgi:hypothetical protein
MAWDTGSPVSATPSDYIVDRITNEIGIGSSPLRNWSLVETLAEGTITPEKQRLTLSTWGAGDSFKITFNGHESAAVNYASDITATLLAAINALVDFNTANTTCAVTRVDVNNYDIAAGSSSRFYGVEFSVVGTFTCTSAVGCSGSFSQSQAPILKSNVAAQAVAVYKCAGTGDDANDCGEDFYVLITMDKSATATALTVALVREWDETYKKVRYCMDYRSGASANPPPVDADGWATFTQTPGWYYQATGSLLIWSVTLNKTGFLYQIKMTKNFMVLSFRVGTTDTLFYLGLMDSLVVGVTDTYPMCVSASNTAGAGAVYGAFVNLTTALGAIGTGVNGAFGAEQQPWTMPPYSSWAISNATNAQDKWANNDIWVARVVMKHMVANANAYLWGMFRGLLKSDILCFCAGGTANVGDTMSVGGTTYTVIGKFGTAYVAITQAN